MSKKKVVRFFWATKFSKVGDYGPLMTKFPRALLQASPTLSIVTPSSPNKKFIGSVQIMSHPKRLRGCSSTPSHSPSCAPGCNNHISRVEKVQGSPWLQGTPRFVSITLSTKHVRRSKRKGRQLFCASVSKSMKKQLMSKKIVRFFGGSPIFLCARTPDYSVALLHPGSGGAWFLEQAALVAESKEFW